MPKSLQNAALSKFIAKNIVCSLGQQLISLEKCKLFMYEKEYIFLDFYG